MNDFEIIDVNHENIKEHGMFCVKDKKYPGYTAKMEWLEHRFAEGLKMKHLRVDGKLVGYLEYIPGEYSWRAINAPDYLVIHCLFIYGKKLLGQGFASALINVCAEDAAEQNKVGIVTVASDGTWLPGKQVFEKNGFELIDTSWRYDLMVKKLITGPTPAFCDWQNALKRYHGWHVVYSNQCPYHIKAVDELGAVANEIGIEVKFHEIKSAKEAQHAPSVYSTFNVIHDGELLEDHYISKTRFKNILNKRLA